MSTAFFAFDSVALWGQRHPDASAMCAVSCMALTPVWRVDHDGGARIQPRFIG